MTVRDAQPRDAAGVADVWGVPVDEVRYRRFLP